MVICVNDSQDKDTILEGRGEWGGDVAGGFSGGMEERLSGNRCAGYYVDK